MNTAHASLMPPQTRPIHRTSEGAAEFYSQAGVEPSIAPWLIGLGTQVATNPTVQQTAKDLARRAWDEVSSWF